MEFPFVNVSDNDLLTAMFGPERDLARLAKDAYQLRHTDDPVKEPPHCSECFEGCPKCQPR